MSVSANPKSENLLPLIAERPTFILHQLNAELARICNPLLRPLGVDLITSRILVIVKERGSVYIGDVVELMALPQSTVSHQVKRLEEAALIKREPDKADSRAIRLALTRKGRTVAERCNRISDALYAEIFADLDAQWQAALSRQLEIVRARLASLSAASIRDEST